MLRRVRLGRAYHHRRLGTVEKDTALCGPRDCWPGRARWGQGHHGEGRRPRRRRRADLELYEVQGVQGGKRELLPEPSW